MGKYDCLLEPIKIGNKTLKNRMIKAPSSTAAFNADQTPSESVIAAYESMAAGGAAAIVLGAALSVNPKAPFPLCGLYDDGHIEPVRALTDAVHKHDCVFIAQIYHGGPAIPQEGGSWCSSTLKEDELPSPVPNFFPTRGLTLDEIASYEQGVIDAAERAKAAGFDGVEIHAANGYLVNSFVSRIFNHRDDRYGCQSIENRTRLACELIEGAKKRCGDDFIVGVRMNGIEFSHPLGNTAEEAPEIARFFEAAGADYISVTGYGYGDNPFQYALDYWQYPEPDASMEKYVDYAKSQSIVMPAAQRVKQAVNVPVITVGSMTEERAAESIEKGLIDIAGFARGIWADNELPNKVASGRIEDIRHCTHCGTCDGLFTERKRCRVNPAFLKETELKSVPTSNPKNILVVGGGASGLEFARTAGERGHKVTVCEKEGTLALELSLATMVKGTDVEDVPSLINWLVSQAQKQPNVDIKLKTEVTPEFAKKLSPDAIVVATGGKYGVPDIPGINLGIVTTVPELTKLAAKPLQLFGPSALNRLSKIALPGIGKHVVVLGGQIEALQAATFLKKRGKDVTILEDSDDIGLRYPIRYLYRCLSWLEKNNVEIIKDVTYREITKKGVEYLKDGKEAFLPCDTVFVVKSPSENLGMVEALKGIAPEIYSIGACNGTDSSLMVDAIYEGRKLGVEI